MRYLFHPSTLLLIAVNLLTIVLAWVEQWNVFALMILYVLQGIIIGGVHYFKVLRLTNFSTENFTKNFPLQINGRYLDISSLDKETAKQKAAGFFLMGYMGFHIVYLLFLGVFMFLGSFNVSVDPSAKVVFTPIFAQVFNVSFLVAVLGFLLTHVVSFYLFKDEQNQPVNLGVFLREPLLRIIPIHVTIILFFIIMNMFKHQFIVVIFFLGLKMLLDIYLHLSQHDKYSEQNTVQASHTGTG
jgi:hypothetical protein